MVDAGFGVWSGWWDMVAAVIAAVFAQARSRFVALDYLRGLLAVTERRSCWQLAELAGHATPGRMQALLGAYRWDAGALVERLRGFLVERLGDPQAVLAIDETAEIKKGTATVGVARQYAGITGQVENCQTAVFLAYVTSRAHALMDFALYLPKTWAGDLARRADAKVPEHVRFATKPQLGIDLLRRAADAAVPFAWVVADEVYGRARALRAWVESIGKGYVFAVPVDFTVRRHRLDPPCTVRDLAGALPAAAWQEYSCGPGCKGHRYYQWAWVATESSCHQVLMRRHPEHPDKITFFFVFVPAARAVTLATIITVAGRRWPVEECFQQGKGQVGLDQHQVRTWQAWHRHTALAITALALLAVATMREAPGPSNPNTPAVKEPTPTGRQHHESTMAEQPERWRDSAPLPTHAHQPPPDDHGMIRVTVPEARRLLNLAAHTLTTTATQFYLAWSDWRRRHQARARWHHYRTRLHRSLTPTPT